MIKKPILFGVLIAVWLLISVTSAATTFYFLPDAATGAVPNAKQSSDTIDRDVASVNATYTSPGLMSQIAGSGSSISEATAAEPGANHYTHYGTWVSPQLASQTISGTVSLDLVMNEGNPNTNAYARVMIYQWYANDTKGSNLLELTNDSTGGELPNAYSTPTTYFSGTSISSVTFAEGDRIVVELESSDRNTRTNTYLHGIRFGGAAGGANSSSITFSQTINEQEFAPVAGFSANQTSGSEPMSIQFTDSSTNTPTNWDWYYGNGTKFSDLQNPVQEFTEGTYTINLYASNGGGGDWENKTNYITVSDSGPVAAFSANNTTPIVGQVILFTDSSTNTPTNWDWYYGNGTKFSDLQNPELAFGAEGAYTINMYASNAFGGDWENKTNYINVGAAGSPPVAAFSANETSGTTPMSVQFTDSSSNSPTSWNWAYKNASVGWTQFSTAQNPEHTFTEGTYDINLTATNAFGSDDELKVGYIIVSAGGSQAPVAEFTADDTLVCPQDPIQFTDLSTNSPTTWYWDFGDTSTNTTRNPIYRYSTNGIFTVKLKASNAFGFDWENKTSYIGVGEWGACVDEGETCVA